jgi:hypothetical protein
MILNRCLVAVALLLLLGCGTGKHRLDGRTAGILAGATKVEVFRIDGRNDPPDPTPIKPGDPTVDGYAILARGKDQNREFASKLTDILTDDKTYTDIHAACFWPGVAFRLWKGEQSVDVIICFHCDNFYLGPPTDKRVMENASFGGSPNRVRLVRLAKEAFPDDEEVQELKD